MSERWIEGKPRAAGEYWVYLSAPVPGVNGPRALSGVQWYCRAANGESYLLDDDRITHHMPITPPAPPAGV